MGTRNQIPLHFTWALGSDGRPVVLTQQAAFYLQQLGDGLPPSGTGFVIDATATTYGQATLYQGAEANRSGTPATGDIYFAIDTGNIFVARAGVWVLQEGVLTGDITKPANSNVTSLVPVITPDTVGSTSQVPIITFDNKGRIIAATSVPVTAGSPAGADKQLQFNDLGVFGASPNLTFDQVTNVLDLNGFAIHSDIAADSLVIRNDIEGNNTIWGIQGVSPVAATGPNLSFYRSRGTYAAPTVISSGDRIGSMSFKGYDGVGFQTASVVIGRAHQNWTSTAHGSDLLFAVTQDNAIATTNMLIMAHNGSNPLYTFGTSPIFRIPGTALQFDNSTSSATFALISAFQTAQDAGGNLELVRLGDLHGAYNGDMSIFSAATRRLTLSSGDAVGLTDAAFLTMTGGSAIGTSANGGSIEVLGGDSDPLVPGKFGGSASYSGGDGYGGGDLVMSSGDGTGGNGGSVTVRAGASASAVGGDVTFVIGSSGSSTYGSFVIQKPLVGDILRIDNNEAWQIFGNAGIKDQVLTSQGASSPVWANVQANRLDYTGSVGTGFSHTLLIGVNILELTGVLATGTVITPASPNNGDVITFSFTNTVTALTMTPAGGQTISNAPTTASPGIGFSFIYRTANTKWYRLY